jgi:hypothetical protein
MVTTARTYPLRDLVRRARGLTGPDVPLPEQPIQS